MKKRPYEQAYLKVIEVRNDILTVSGFRMTNEYSAGAAEQIFNYYTEEEEL